jgi:hypothetical protein
VPFAEIDESPINYEKRYCECIAIAFFILKNYQLFPTKNTFYDKRKNRLYEKFVTQIIIAFGKKTLLPSNDIYRASRHDGISPDGKIIVWIRNYFECWITQKEEKKWPTPKVFISLDESPFIHDLVVSQFRSSNTNFTHLNRN